MELAKDSYVLSKIMKNPKNLVEKDEIEYCVFKKSLESSPMP